MCHRGATTIGSQIELAPSCFALKLYKMLGLWEKQEFGMQEGWISYLQSFQVAEGDAQKPILRNAFVDPAIMHRHMCPTFNDRMNAIKSMSAIEIFRKILKKAPLNRFDRYVVAETKQTLATLNEIGKAACHPYQEYPRTPKSVYSYVSSFDWRLPWGAGGQTSAICAFIAIESERELEAEMSKRLGESIFKFYTRIADPETGGYFQGARPSYGMLVNGAMKVITALDWLNKPIHYPDQLLSTVIQDTPRQDGCHLVDCVYVIYRCLNEVERGTYDLDRVMDYLETVIDLIWLHHNDDGGFSYSIGAAQKWYYGMRVSNGFRESDIHGTILLVWALAMIFQLKGDGLDWKVIKP